jgi:hypothetical protein
MVVVDVAHNKVISHVEAILSTVPVRHSNTGLHLDQVISGWFTTVTS